MTVAMYSGSSRSVSTPSVPAEFTGRELAHCHFSASERAVIAAWLVQERIHLVKPTIRQAAALAGVSVPYVQAALRLDVKVLTRVALGEVSLVDAERGNGLIAAYLTASADGKIAFARAVGTDKIWDEAISPVIS